MNKSPLSLALLALLLGVSHAALARRHAWVRSITFLPFMVSPVCVAFGVLLLGRWRHGWRGAIAVRWTLTAMALLVLAFFGSKFVLELVLHRTG